MRQFSKNKTKTMKHLSDEEGIIGSLAIEQCGALKKMLSQNSGDNRMTRLIIVSKQSFQRN